jgi:hypothetical protein
LLSSLRSADSGSACTSDSGIVVSITRANMPALSSDSSFGSET